MSEDKIQISGWKIIRVIGKGSFGCVYEVEKEGAFGSVAHSALKVISIPETDAEVKAYRDDGYDDASLTDLFRTQVEDITAEFELMSKLKGDSHIVSYEDHSIVQHEHDPGYDIFIRMELLTPLPDHINRAFPDGRISDAAVVSLGTDICRALERCGRHNIIHRDIKPQNIFVNEEGDFKLGDFGIAKTSDHTTRATKTGTYGYMAPEVYRSLPYNASVDIYSLGLVLYWMLNERRGPFLPLPPAVPRPSQNSDALDRRMRGEPLPAPKNGSEELKRIVLKACAYDPKDRYSNPAEMRRDLERAAMGQCEMQTASPVYTFKTSESANAYEATVGAYRKETDADHTVSAMSEPVKAKEPERPTLVVTSAPVPEVILPSWPKEAYDATVSMFSAETATGRAYAEDGTIRAAAKPVSEAGAAFSEDTDATVGLFAKKPETVKPPVKKEPERKPEPAPKPEKPAATKPQPAPKPENKQAERKSAGKGSKKTLLIIAAAAALAVIAAVVLIVVLVGKGKPSQQAEAPTAAPTEAPTDASTKAPTQKPTKKPTSTPTQQPTKKPTPTPTKRPSPTPEPTTAIEGEYSAALALYNAGRYEEAIRAFEALNGYKDSDERIVKARLKGAAVGDSVILGSYEQDNNASNGNEKIEWLVLAKDGDRILLISRYALDCQRFHDTEISMTWENCSLRIWLNDTFYSTAFSSDEKAMILSSKVTADINPKCNTPQGNDTTDKVFLLSTAEAERYFTSDQERRCEGTDYCFERGAHREGGNYCRWWLRTSGYNSQYAARIKRSGEVYYGGDGVGSNKVAVRPAIWINP